jgi:hypothetical protein
MGLLDDAIREHLELKRLRGADPQEVARQEREALGPVRRGVDDPLLEQDAGAAPAGASASAEPSPVLFDAEDGPADDDLPPALEGPLHDPDPPHGDPLIPHHVPADEGEHLVPDPSAPLAAGDATAEYDVAAALEAEEVAAPVEAPVEPPRAGAPVPPPPPAPPVHEPHDDSAAAHPAPAFEEHEPARPAPPAEPPGPGEPPAGEEREDVLEETPDFLQETPEHERLWFEQRPPRDFDFGGS